VTLTSLGIGAIIGTGIFVLTGIAAHDKAGPALMISFVVSGIACIFAALCYAEFASMVPVAGSAYTYAYATLGEFMAWRIGCGCLSGSSSVWLFILPTGAVTALWRNYGRNRIDILKKPAYTGWDQADFYLHL
jgi:amino acid transporter